jgi:hypothetical protein
MYRQCLALLVLLFAPAASMAQRYGRPYTLAESAPLYLQVKAQDKSHYFSPWDLQKMPRSAVTLTDPATNVSHIYEGVALERLVPTVAPQAGTIQIEFGSHQSLLLSGTDLDPESKALVVDTVDGKPLPGHVPYYLLEKCRGKPLQKITEVRSITVKSSS